MKKFCFFLLGLIALYAQAQELAKDQQEKSISLEVTAPLSESFMGRTFHFAYWQVFAVNSYLPTPILTLQPSWTYRPNKNGIPNIAVEYTTKRGITPNTPLGIEDELLSFTTEITEPTHNSHAQVISCAEGVVSYSIFEGQDIITTVITKHAAQGNIIFSGVLKRSPKKSIEVNTKQIKTDFGTFTNEHKTVKLDTKSIEKEALKYARAMCQKPFPEWLKNIPTIEEIHNQTGEQSQKSAVVVSAKKAPASNKKITAPTKTIVPKLQRGQPVYHSGK